MPRGFGTLQRSISSQVDGTPHLKGTILNRLRRQIPPNVRPILKLRVRIPEQCPHRLPHTARNPTNPLVGKQRLSLRPHMATILHAGTKRLISHLVNIVKQIIDIPSHVHNALIVKRPRPVRQITKPIRIAVDPDSSPQFIFHKSVTLPDCLSQIKYLLRRQP